MATQLRTFAPIKYQSDNITLIGRYENEGFCQMALDGNYAHTSYPDGSDGAGIIDVTKPQRLKEVGNCKLEPLSGHNAPQTNHLEMDHRSLFYIMDKARGFDVIEFKR